MAEHNEHKSHDQGVKSDAVVNVAHVAAVVAPLPGGVIAAKPNTTATPTSATAAKKLSPKHKQSRGIDPSLITTWVPFDQSKELHERIFRAAKFRGVTVVELLSDMLELSVRGDEKTLIEDAGKYTPAAKGTSVVRKKLEEMSQDELIGYQAKQEKQAEAAVTRAQAAAKAAQDMLARARQKKAAGEALAV